MRTTLVSPLMPTGTLPAKETAWLLADALDLTGGQRAHFEAVAAWRPWSASPAGPDVAGAPQTLPRDIGSFTGRQAELSQLVRQLSATDGGIVAIHAIGGMPLAISLAAGQLKHHPSWTAVDLPADLVAARDRLELLQAENLSVAAAFGLSYQDLGDGQRPSAGLLPAYRDGRGAPDPWLGG
ncbi:MAG: hypothetical protein ABJB47_16245 [Actinomycetota bacterium]